MSNEQLARADAWQQPAGQFKNFAIQLASASKMITAASAGRVEPQQAAYAVALEVRQSPQLQKCSAVSVLQTIIYACGLGLFPGKARGLVWLVPFDVTVKGPDGKPVKAPDGRNLKQTICTPIVGYKGMVLLACRPGGADNVDAFPLFDGDQFDWSYTHQGLVFSYKPKKFQAQYKRQKNQWGREENMLIDPRKLVGAAAVVFRGGRLIKLTDLDEFQIAAARMRSKSSSNGPWVTDEPAMAAKTAVRRSMSVIPLDGDAGAAMARVATVGAVAEEVADVAGPDAADVLQQQYNAANFDDAPDSGIVDVEEEDAGTAGGGRNWEAELKAAPAAGDVVSLIKALADASMDAEERARLVKIGEERHAVLAGGSFQAGMQRIDADRRGK